MSDSFRDRRIKLNRKKKIVTFFSVLLVVVLASLIYYFRFDSFAKKDYNDIHKDNVLHIVTSLDPIGYYISGDTISGFNHDMLHALQNYSDLKFEISVENSLDKSLNGLKTGNYDLIARNIPINANLRNEYSFTNPIILNKLVLIQRKAKNNDGIEPIRNHLDLGHKTIYVPKDSPSILRLQNLSMEIGDTIFIAQDSVYEPTQLAMMVAAGDIDYTVSDAKTAQRLMSKFPELDVKTDIGFTHLEGWAVRSNSPILLDSLNAWIGRFKSTEEYSKIYAKYYK